MSRRQFLSRSALAGAALAGGPGLLAACGGGGEDLMAQGRERGFIRVGFANERPYGFANEEGKVTGEAPEVAKAALEKLGIGEIDGVVTEFGSLIPSLNAGRFDMVAAGMFITPDRCQQVTFSDPDYCAPQALAVKAGNPMGLSDYQSVKEKGARLGVMSGAVEERHANEVGIEDVVVLADPPSLVDALRGGRVDAFALTSITVREQTEDQSGIEATEPFVYTNPQGEEELGCGGYAFRPENRAFRDEFNRVLNEMQENNEIAPIVKPFGFGQEEVDLAKDKTAQELCQG